MSLRRIWVLLTKEFVQGSRNFIFIFAIVVPIVISLIVTLLFGTLFSGRARLGVVDEGDSALTAAFGSLDAIIFRTYETEDDLFTAVAEGALDIGLILPANFDGQVIAGTETDTLTVYIWGESQLKNRAILETVIVSQLRQLAGRESPVTIKRTLLGDTEVLPWEERLLPFIVLMTILIGGIMVPATSLVEEKAQRTLTALTITSSSTGEVYVAKALLGVLISMVMGVLILLINRAFPAQVGLLLFVLALGTTLAAVFGILLGNITQDINALFTMIKGLGILLYAPAIIYLFPSIPQWIGRIFPTYYIIQPVIEITQNGAGFADVALELGVLVLLIGLLVAAVNVTTRRAQLRPA